VSCGGAHEAIFGDPDSFEHGSTQSMRHGEIAACATDRPAGFDRRGAADSTTGTGRRRDFRHELDIGAVLAGTPTHMA
jgi:hypothetical protein